MDTLRNTKRMIYIYTDIPGAGKGWLLGVDATGKVDAQQYIQNVCRGGRFVSAVPAVGKLPCDCLATTSERQKEISSSLRDR